MNLISWLEKQFEHTEHPPPARSLRALAEVTERLVPLYLGAPRPLRRSAIAKKLAKLARNLRLAAKSASELGEKGMFEVLLASDGNRDPEREDALAIIAKLADLANWAQKAAEVAQQINRSTEDYKGGRPPETRLRGLVTILMDRYETLLAIRATHVIEREIGLGHSTFDLFVKEAIRLHGPQEAHFEPTLMIGPHRVVQVEC